MIQAKLTTGKWALPFNIIQVSKFVNGVEQGEA